MKCPQCEYDDIPEGSRFCPKCGAALAEMPRPSTQVTVTQNVHSVESGKVTGVDIGQVIGSVFIGSRGEDETRERRDKRILLEKVKRFWVESMLQESVRGAALIEISKEMRPDAVERPWDTVVPSAESPGRQVPSDKKIADVFDEAEHALLILDGMGSGKTTTLLSLAQDTIERAEHDPLQPIPVVLNLSSWTRPRQPIADWVVEELSAKYQIPRRIGSRWLENNDLALLLDGLDEVEAGRRKACIAAINRFRQDYGLVQIGICSRTQEYETAATPLKLSGAILLQPLTPDQIESYLTAAGPQVETLRQILQEDATLQALARSPLMLNIMRLAYQDIPAEALSGERLNTVEERRKHLLDAYVERMFRRRAQTKVEPFSRERVTRWLAWLAHRLTQDNQSVFLIEQIQQDWLSSGAQRWLYWLASRSVVGLLVGLGLAGTAEVGGDLAGRIAYILTSTLAGLMVGWMDGLRAKRTKGHDPGAVPWPAWATTAGRTLGIGLVTGLLFWLVFGVGLSLGADGWRLGAGSALAYGLLFGLASRRPDARYDIQPAEALRWSWAEAAKGLIPGLLLASGAVAIVALIFAASNPLVIWLTYGLVYGLLAAMAVTLIFGLRGRRVESKSFPNQGIWLSTRNAARAGSLLGVIAGVTYGLVYGALPGLVVALRVGLLGLLAYGAFDVIKHLTLRLILCVKKHVPWRISLFLDHAAELGFLQKVGGGYIFANRLLKEYFEAALER